MLYSELSIVENDQTLHKAVSYVNGIILFDACQSRLHILFRRRISRSVPSRYRLHSRVDIAKQRHQIAICTISQEGYLMKITTKIHIPGKHTQKATTDTNALLDCCTHSKNQGETPRKCYKNTFFICAYCPLSNRVDPHILYNVRQPQNSCCPTIIVALIYVIAAKQS